MTKTLTEKEKSEVTCLRITKEDIKRVALILKSTGGAADASTVMRGLMRLGLALLEKQSKTDKSKAILNLIRAGSLD